MLSGPDDSFLPSMPGGLAAADLNGILAMGEGMNLPPMLMMNPITPSVVSSIQSVGLLP